MTPTRKQKPKPEAEPTPLPEYARYLVEGLLPDEDAPQPVEPPSENRWNLTRPPGRWGGSNA